MTDIKEICPICGEEFVIRNLRNPQKTCGKRMCVVNYEYQEKHYNQRTGFKPDPEEMKKWQ